MADTKPTPNCIQTPFRVCLLGASLDNPNRGVCALAASFFHLVAQARPDAHLYSLYGNRTGGITTMPSGGRQLTIQIVNYRQSLRFPIHQHIAWILLMCLAYRWFPFARKRICESVPWIDALDKASFIGDIRGGDSFSDIYSLKKFVLGILPTMTPLLMGRPLVLLPQTFIPFKSRIAQSLARWIMRQTQRIYARDKSSLQFARQMIPADTNKVMLSPDVAFALEPIMPEASDVVPPLESAERPLVGFNINGMLYNERPSTSAFGIRDSYRHFSQLLLKTILRESNVHVLLVPHVFSTHAQDDLMPCRELAATAGDASRVHIVNRALGPNQLKALIGHCDLFVGSRMHSCIAALSQGVPCLGVAYSPKFGGVFQSVGAADYVLDASELGADALVERIMQSMETAGRDAALLEKVRAARDQLRETFDSMLNKEASRGCHTMAGSAGEA